MLALIEEVLNAGKRQGFGLTRLWANMEWALRGNLRRARYRRVRDQTELHLAQT